MDLGFSNPNPIRNFVSKSNPHPFWVGLSDIFVNIYVKAVSACADGAKSAVSLEVRNFAWHMSRIRFGILCLRKKCYWLFAWLIFIRSRRRTASVMLVPDQERIRIENLQNRIRSGLKKIRVRTPLQYRCNPSLSLCPLIKKYNS